MALDVYATALSECQILDIYRHSRYSGVRQTAYFAQWVSPPTTKADVKSEVRSCEECQSINPVPVHERKGKLDVNTNWSRLGLDITHYSGGHFPTLIDCRPSRFVIWQLIWYQNSATVAHQLEAIFCKQGQLNEFLTDNNTTFTSRNFRKFLKDWGVRLHLQCANALSGNRIMERCQRTIKTIAARKLCTGIM